MQEAMEQERQKELYKKRKSTVEPVLGFRQFLLRGLKKVNLEWQLVSCAYNLKRLAVLVRYKVEKALFQAPVVRNLSVTVTLPWHMAMEVGN